jgi:uncharacterized protein YbjT (DUF2867 family)
MKVLVFGATGGSGRAAIEHLVSQGHEVTAFTRATKESPREAGVRYLAGDVMNRDDVSAAVAGQDAVIVTLGIRENPLRVRFFGPARTPLAVRSAGTRNIIAAMKQHGVRKLVVQTSYGVGETRARLGFADKLFFDWILKPQIDDTEQQERDVFSSGLDWVIVQPVHLTDDADDAMPFASMTGDTNKLKVSRNSVGRFLAHSAETHEFVRRSVAISGRA